MWDLQKRRRFQELRGRTESLAFAEQAELADLLQEIEDQEAGYLSDATRRNRQNRVQTEEQNRSLEALVARRKALIAHLEGVLSLAHAERNAIDSELALVLAGLSGEG